MSSATTHIFQPWSMLKCQTILKKYMNLIMYCLEKKPIGFFSTRAPFRDYFCKLKSGASIWDWLLFEIKPTELVFEVLRYSTKCDVSVLVSLVLVSTVLSVIILAFTFPLESILNKCLSCHTLTNVTIATAAGYFESVGTGYSKCVCVFWGKGGGRLKHLFSVTLCSHFHPPPRALYTRVQQKLAFTALVQW